MKRREFLKKSAIAAACTLPAAPAYAAGKKRWRLALAIPKTFPVWSDAIKRFAENVERLTNRSLRIKVYGAGELVPALETFEAVKSGEIEMAHSAAYYHQGKVPETPFFCTVPFGLDTQGALSWLSDGGGQKLWDELMNPFGVKCLPLGGVGPQMTGWFNREIKTIDDFKGLKIRVPGLAGKVYAKAGATPVLIAGGEVFTSLATGVIDAVEWTDPFQDYVMGLHKAAKYYYGPCWHEPGAILELMINSKAWQSLDKATQTAVQVAAGEASQWMINQWIAKKGPYLAKIRENKNVKIGVLPQNVLAKLKTYSEEVKLELAKSAIGKKIYRSYTEFQKAYNSYNKIAVLPFENTLFS
ncbi:MAG: TRAP transporter substrate-binding protein [Candidatus Dadabacteria bacterium]|nr:MAG: TRAP transporter substrate-binding protein [Candidatus Dadabacteria bacterium]